MTLEMSSGLAMSRMPPCWTFGARSVRPWVWRGLVCRLATFTPSTTTEIGRVDAGFQNPRRPRCGVRDHLLDQPALACILAGEHEDRVALADLGDPRTSGGHHSTSGASETI